MYKKIRQSMALVAIAALVCIPLQGTARAQESYAHESYAHESYMFDGASAETMTVDALLVRPLGIVSMVLGSALFVVSLPFAATGGNIGQASRKLVADPAKFTFTRPLGDFSAFE